MDYYSIKLNEHEINLILACLETIINLYDDELEIDVQEVEELQAFLYHQLSEMDEDTDD